MATTTPPTTRPPKSMSSRLLTMKFMQRAAASASASSPTPTTPDEPSPKRQKLDADASPSRAEPASADLRAVQAAVAAEEAKREEALERQAAEAGETKWFLSFRPEERDGVDGALGNGLGNGGAALRVMSASYSGLDHESVSADQDEGSFRPAAVVGRRSFGRFNRALEKRLNGNDEASSSSEDDDSGSANNADGDEDDPTETNELIRASREEATQRAKAERKAQRRAAKAEAARLAEKRKSKEVKLNKLGSISNGGNAMNQNVECFNCGGKGHRKNECPQPKRKEKRKKDGFSGGDQPKKSRAL